MISLFFFFFLKTNIRYHFFFFFSSRRRHTRFSRDWSSDVCSSDLNGGLRGEDARAIRRGRGEAAGGSVPPARPVSVRPRVPGVVAEAADVRDIRRLAPRRGRDAEDGVEAVSRVRHLELGDGHGVP